MMESVYRCANCGQVIRHPEAVCPACRYQRDPTLFTEPVYDVFLDSFGPDVSQTASVLMKLTRKTLRETLALQESLPVRLMTSKNSSLVAQFANSLQDCGAIVRVTQTIQEPESLPEQSSSGSLTHKRESPEKQKVRWLIPMLVFFTIIANLIPEIMERLPDFRENVISLFTGEEMKNFRVVTVVATSRDLDGGVVITMDDVKPLTVFRSEAPEGAIAPLAVDLVIGRRTVRPLARNQIIQLDMLVCRPGEHLTVP